MKRQIRQGVFETNSSSTHAVAILTDEEYQKFEKGDLIVSRDGQFITKEEYEKLQERAKQNNLKYWTRVWEEETLNKGGYWHNRYASLEDLLENESGGDWNYEYDRDYMEIEHDCREIGGQKVHAISVYGYET